MKDMAGTNFNLVELIVKAVESVGEKPLVYNTHEAPRRLQLQHNIQETRNQKTASKKAQEVTQQ